MHFFKKNFSLQTKLLLVVFSSLLLLIVVFLIAGGTILLNSYLKIEQDIGAQNIDRVEDTIQNMSNQLVIKLTDWSSWDDTYDFAQDSNSAYIISNLGEQSIANLKINAMFFYNSKNELVFRRMVDFNEVVEISSDNLYNHLLSETKLVKHDSVDSTVVGFVMLPEGPMLLASRPILTSSNTGPMQGSLLFGKFLDQETIDSISKLTHTSTEIFDIDSNSLPPDVLLAKSSLLKEETYLVKPLSSDSVAGYKLIRDLYDNPILIAKITTSRPIYNQGLYSLYFFIGTIIVLVALFGVLLVFFMRKLIVNRISFLSKEVGMVGNIGDSVSRVTESGNDEIGALALKINSMVRSIESSGKIFEQQAKELKKFQLAVQNASDQIVITDADGIVLYGNDSVERITGYKPEEAIGKKAGALWKTPMPTEYYENMWDIIKNKKQIFSDKIQNKRKNGTLYFADISISPVLDDKSNVIFFVAIEHDITKEVEIEKNIRHEKEIVEKLVVERTKELKNEQARLLASLNSLSFGFIIADMNHNVILKNNAIIKLFGLSGAQEVSIDDISNFLGNNFNIKTSVQNCLVDKTTCEIKEIIFGSKLLRAIIAPVLADESKETIGYVFLLEDVTDARALERSRDEFFSIASHELRTPLTAIRGNSRMLLDEYKEKMLDKDMPEMIEDIYKSSVSLIDIVNDFLEVSRLEQGKLEIKKENFDMSDLIQSVILDMKEMTLNNGVNIVYMPDSAKLPLIFSDKAKIKQVLFNLLGNSVKFMKTGIITIKTELIDGSIKISVTDTGIGISEQNQGLLFRKFQQAGEQVLARDVTKGTGLGLYICRLILLKLDGNIFLEKSVLGEGSTFAFTLPVGL